MPEGKDAPGATLGKVKLWKDQHLRLSLTGLGLQVLVAMVLVGVFAVNSGNNLLYLVFAMLLGIFVVSGSLSRRAIRDLEFTAFEEHNLFARVRGGLRLRLLDRSPGRLRAVEVHLELGEGRVEPGFIGRVEGDGEFRLTLQVQPQRRGWTRVVAVEFRTRFPFGFLEKGWRIPLDQRLLVNPHPRAAKQVWGRSGEALHPLSRTGTASPDSARPFRPGDPLGRIHWKRTAQRSEPWVRTFEDERPAGLHLELDLGAWVPGLAFEQELERLSGLILQARLHKQEVHLEIRGGPQGIQSLWGCTTAWRALAQAEALRPGPGTVA